MLVTLDPKRAPGFTVAAESLLRDTQLRQNVRHATDVITRKRNAVTGEMPDWAVLRQAGSAMRDATLNHLGTYLQQFEERFQAAGGVVHWAEDAEEARTIVLQLVRATGSADVLKIKSMTTAEIGLNAHLQANGITPHETDLAELILQLGRDEPSHIVVPALHKNRQQVRALFAREMNLPDLADSAEALTEAARRYLRQRFLATKTAICGANFLIAETGSIVIVESEGNGRMCLTLPETLIAVVGIEKVLARYSDLGVLLQTLPRSATGERMNPYNSIWTGVRPGDGPQHLHVVLLDNGRSRILNNRATRQTLKCIRCGACQNACPVYRETGGHAYGSVYGGPIGAILTPQLQNLDHAQTLPFASSLCGACYEVCPVAINIPQVLTHLRGEVVARRKERFTQEAIGMRLASRIFSSAKLFATAQKAARSMQHAVTDRHGWIHRLPGMGARWTELRDLRAVPEQSFREWWIARSATRASAETRA